MKEVLTPSSSWILVSLAVGVIYVALPAGAFLWFGQDPYMLALAKVCFVGICGIIVGYHLPIIDRFAAGRTLRLYVNSKPVHLVIWAAFLTYLAVTLITADIVPIISALGNASVDQLSNDRANFLKLRSGWEAVLPYLSTIFVGVLLPYSTTRLFLERNYWGFAAFFLFIVYTLLSLEKILFVLAVAPIAALVVILKHSWRKALPTLAGLFVFSAGVLYLNTVLASGNDYFSRGVPPVHSEVQADDIDHAFSGWGTVYFNIHYQPSSAPDLIFWRAFAVPVITAADGLRVFDERFDGRHLLGATSSFVARLAGLERVNFDAEVFAYQFGSSATGRANSVFLVDAFVNFGWLAVVGFSLIVGQAFRFFAKSDDIAFQAMWPIFAWFIFSGSLLGTLLSNGFAMLFVVMFFFRIAPEREPLPTVGGAATKSWRAWI